MSSDGLQGPGPTLVPSCGGIMCLPEELLPDGVNVGNCNTVPVIPHTIDTSQCPIVFGARLVVGVLSITLLELLSQVLHLQSRLKLM